MLEGHRSVPTITILIEPEQWRGTLGDEHPRLDHAFGIEPPLVAYCRHLYEKGRGKSLGSGDHDYAVVQCDLLFSFVRAARLTGAELTRARAASALQSSGPLETAFWGGGAFAPRKFDMADQIQVDRWTGDASASDRRGRSSGAVTRARPTQPGKGG